MDLRQLKYFTRIVESGSLSKAADLLNVAQPSLSLQLKNLEEDLGAELLSRHARGVTPTHLGLEFYEYARHIIDEADRLKDVIRSRADNPVGRVSVGLPTSACRGVCLELFESVSSNLSNVTLNIVEGMTGHLDEWIQAGRLDVALLYNHRAYEHVAWTELIVEELVLLVPSDSPEAKLDEIAFSDLAGLHLTCPAPPNVLRTVIDHCAARSDTTLTITDCNSLHGMLQFMATGRMMIMPRFAFAAELQTGHIKAVPIVDPTPSWHLSVVLSERTVNIRASQAVAGVLAEVIKRLVETGIWVASLSGTSSPRRSRPEGL